MENDAISEALHNLEDGLIPLHARLVIKGIWKPNLYTYLIDGDDVFKSVYSDD